MDSHEDRRIRPRFAPAFAVTCRIPPQGEYRDSVAGTVWNISATGLCMLTSTRLRRDDYLTGVLETELVGELTPVAIRIIHVVPVASGDCLIGARFSNPLPAELLGMLLKLPMPAK